MTTTALLGTGLLGTGMVENLLAKGHTVRIWNRSRAKLEPLVQEPGFTGRAPGGPSRWSTERSAEWEPLRPVLVAEVSFDHVTGGRFRHGTRFVRWRPDKAPRQCTMAQLLPHAG